MGPGARSKFGAPHVRTWGVWEANVLYWRKYLWHCWDFSAPPVVIWRPRIDSTSGELWPPFPLVTPLRCALSNFENSQIKGRGHMDACCCKCCAHCYCWAFVNALILWRHLVKTNVVQCIPETRFQKYLKFKMSIAIEKTWTILWRRDIFYPTSPVVTKHYKNRLLEVWHHL